MTTLEKNILSVSKGVICHQVNCEGVMGAGLAFQLKKAHPEVYAEYRKLCLTHMDDNYNLLGQIQVVPVETNKWVINMFGQYDTGGSRATEYSAFSQCMSALKEWVSKNGNELWKAGGESGKVPVYMPYKIGCGLGGGDWPIIKEIISKKLPDTTFCKLV